MIKLAIFDFDGTIVDSMYYWRHAPKEFAIKIGLKPESNLDDIFMSMSLPEGANYLINKYSLNMSNEEICNGINEIMFNHYMNDIKIRPHMVELLDYFYNNNISIAMATSTEKSILIKSVKKLNLDKYFKYIITSSEVGCSKKKPDIYMKCSDFCNVKYNESIIFEDLPYGLISTTPYNFHRIGIYDAASDKEKDKVKENSELFIENLDSDYVTKVKSFLESIK